MYRALLLLSIAFVFTCCTGEKANNSTGNTDGANTTASKNNTSAPAAVLTTRNIDSHESPFSRLWVAKFAVEADMAEYKGRWFNLKGDGTFESGKWQETNNTGMWSIEKEKMIISFIFSKPESIPTRWEIQGAGGGGKILFKGNILGNEKGIQVMLEPESVLPVKP